MLTLSPFKRKTDARTRRLKTEADMRHAHTNIFALRFFAMTMMYFIDLNPNSADCDIFLYFIILSVSSYFRNNCGFFCFHERLPTKLPNCQHLQRLRENMIFT